MVGLLKTKNQPPNRAVFILGRSLQHSLSPLMQNAAFRASGLSVFYAPLELDLPQIKAFFTILKSPNVLGANVTVPYKEAVLDHLDFVEKDAADRKSVV